MKKIKLESVVWKEGKFYVAQCLNVDVSSFGNSKNAALKNLDEALELYFEDITDLNIITKIETPEIVERSLNYA